MHKLDDIEINFETNYDPKYDLDGIIYDLDTQLDMLASNADYLDNLLAIASGVVCGMLDIIWVGEFSLERGRDISNDKIEKLVVKIANLKGYKGEDLAKAVEFLEGKFPIPSDGNTPDFGGGKQHHLRDFAHHPTIVGLIFSLLTQFTYKSFGTDTGGCFKVVEVTAASRVFIGQDVQTKIVNGTITWLFHLVSDMAGSSSTAGKGGGTGIPGPVLSLAKELSTLPIFRDLKVGDKTLSVFLSKLFNGTLFAKRDEDGKIINDTVIKFDLRGELGAGLELGRQAIPVLANECIVRCFYTIRRLGMELKKLDIISLDNMNTISWDDIKPMGNPSIARMLTIATGVFTTVDVGEAIITEKYWLSVNYIGVGRFAIAIGEDASWCLKYRKVQDIKQMYEGIKGNSFRTSDNRVYKRIGEDMNGDKLGLTVEQTEILYNIEFYKTLNDIQATKVPVNSDGIKELKTEWLNEWKEYMTTGFPSFLQVEDAELHWYSEEDLIRIIENNQSTNTWLRLVVLESILFEPYYPLSLEKNKKGNEVPSKKYNSLQNPLNGYKKSVGDKFIGSFISDTYCSEGYVKRLRKCYDKVIRELNEVLKTAITSISITAIVALAVVATAGIFAPTIAVALVGSNFAGLSGIALSNACLAYLGGGAVAVGGAGMLGGTATIVGGGAILGIGVGAGASGAVGAASLRGKKSTIRQSAKLLVAIREIFLNDEHDIDYSNSVYEMYTENIKEIEKGIVDLKHNLDDSKGEERKETKAKIKKAEESVKAMKVAKKSLSKFISSFETGMKSE